MSPAFCQLNYPAVRHWLGYRAMTIDASDHTQYLAMRVYQAHKNWQPNQVLGLEEWVALAESNAEQEWARHIRREKRRRRRTEPLDLVIPEPSTPPDRSVELLEQVASLLQRLTEKELEVFLAVCLDRQPLTAAAAQLGITREAVKQRLHDGRQRLPPCQ